MNKKKQIKLILTEEEARKVLYCLERSLARNQHEKLTNIHETLEETIEFLYNQIQNLNNEDDEKEN